LVIAIIAIIWYANQGNKIPPMGESNYSPLGMAPENIGGVGIEGTGGDAILNREKNRFGAPKNYSDVTVSEVIGIPTQKLSDAGREKRDRWPREALDYDQSEESRGLRLTGYIVHAKESGPESCNGYSDSLRDFHIWICDYPTDSKANGVIVEMTPRWKSLHPKWRLHILEKLADEHAKVRVSGWLMWDEEHPDEVGKSRGSQWEVHPVTNFEIFSNGQWEPLDSAPEVN